MATVAASGVQGVQHPFLMSYVDLTTIEPNQPINVSHGGPANARILMVTHETIVAPTSKDLVEVRHIAASDSTDNSTAKIEVGTTPTGDLTGATVRVWFWFVMQGGVANGVDVSTPL